MAKPTNPVTQGNAPVDELDDLSFLTYVEGLGHKTLDPLSKEALDLQARYVAALPQHPLDILRRLSTNVFCTPSERINAVKALMAYTMRAVPTNLELSGKDGAPLKIDASSLSALTSEELDTLQVLLAKTGK
jgi:hypothetical protein